MKKIEMIELLPLDLSYYEDLKSLMLRSYPNLKDPFWKKEQLDKLISLFPQGQIMIKINGKIVACSLSILVTYRLFEEHQNYREITGNFSFSTHSSRGEVMYGLDLLVDPEYRGMRLGRRMYEYRKELCEEMNLRSIVFGGRIPNYQKHQKKLSAREYIQKVRTREIHDPVLSFQLSNDFQVIRIVSDYFSEDPPSREYAVLMEWPNIYYSKKAADFKPEKSTVRMGLVQWQMRSYGSIKELSEQIEFFVDAVSGYEADFIMFPEYINAPLMAEYNHLSEADAIRKLAGYTDTMRDLFSEYAINYNINIITGSMPEVRDEKLYNIGHLCKRNGEIEKYEKIHITPSEVSAWGMAGGNKIKTFDTDSGKVGILICYDIEFPELSRLLALQGLDILFVPFMTDTQNGYSRVRNCAQARAVENECYVAVAGSVGNLPKVHNMDIQFAQSVVFTPCDFAFPTTGIKAEATPNTEKILVVDVDLDLLKELHSHGSVRILKDRRTDLYDVVLKSDDIL